MASIIQFRTKIHSEGEHMKKSKKNISNCSLDMDGVHIMDAHDDARRISWKHTARSIYPYIIDSWKQESVSLLVLVVEDRNLECTVLWIQKKKWINFASERIRISAEHQHIRHEDQSCSLEEIWLWCEKQQKERRKNTLILVFVPLLRTEQYAPFLRLSWQNDLILIPCLHIFEVHPHRKILFASRQIQIIEYKNAIWEHLCEVWKTLRKRWGDFFLLTTEDDPTVALNHFFKKRILF